MKYLKFIFLNLFVLLFLTNCDSVVNPAHELESESKENTSRLPAPALQEPGNGDGDQPVSPKLSWKEVEGAVFYQIRISEGTNDSALVISDSTQNGIYNISGLSPEKTYSWKVRGITKDSIEGVWSDEWSFSTAPEEKEIPVTTTLESPGDGSKGHQTELEFRWTKVADAKNYQLQIAKEPNFSNLQKDTVVETRSFQAAGLSAGQTYHWRVKPFVGNNKTEWSEIFSFRTKAGDEDSTNQSEEDTTNPKVSISSQQDISEGDAVAITASANDSSGVSTIEIYVDDSKVKACPNTTTCSYSSSSYSAGTYSYYATAVDGSLNANSAQSEIGDFTVAESKPSDRTYKIMPLGDSITEAPFGYRVPLWNKLTGEGYSIDYVGSSQLRPHPDLPDTDHEGHSGWTIGQISDKINGWLATYQPDYVLLMIGTNDIAWWQDKNGAKIADAHAALVDQILAHVSADTWVMVASIPPESSKLIEPNKADRAQLTRDFNAEMKKRMQQRIDNGKKVRFVDIHSALNLSHISSDGVHPNRDGYKTIAQTWFESLLPVLQ